MMITRLLTLLFVLSISSCQPKAPPSHNVIVEGIDSADQHKLATYFSAYQINQLEVFANAYKRVKTAHEMHAVYKQIDSIYDGLADSLTAQQQRRGDSIIDLDPINAIVNGIHFAHYEGDAMLINPDLAAFKKAAEYTPEKYDDDFIEIMIDTYGREKYFAMPAWINQTSDYGGTSFLGDEIGLNILTKIQTALAKSKEFEKELNEIRENIFYDILHVRCYEYDSPKIVTELNKVIATVNLSAEEKTKLNKRIEEFKSPSSEIKMGCAKKECKCGE